MQVVRPFIKHILLNSRALSTTAKMLGRTIARENDLLIKDRFRRIYNDSPKLDLAEGRFEFNIPGFAFSDFTRTGKLGVWNLLKTFENFWRHFDNSETIQALNISNAENMIVMTSSQAMEVSRELYERAAIVRPMKITVRRGHSGMTSVSIFTELWDAETGVLYGTNQRQLIGFDIVQNKSLPVEIAFGNFKEHSDPNAKPVIVPEWKPAPDAYKYLFEVPHSDSDFFYHTNRASYVKLCANAAANACNDSKLNNFSGDFLRYDVSSALIRYLGESFPGDELEVTLWEDQDDIDSLYFHISRSNKLIHTAKYTYFKPTFSKL